MLFIFIVKQHTSYLIRRIFLNVNVLLNFVCFETYWQFIKYPSVISKKLNVFKDESIWYQQKL